MRSATRRSPLQAASGSLGFEPCFKVADVARAVDHYERLGFKISHHDDRYAFAHRGSLTIHLTPIEGSGTAGDAVLYIHVEDADQLAEDWRKAGMEVVGPENKEYGKREGTHADPDGNLIRFGSPLTGS